MSDPATIDTLLEETNLRMLLADPVVTAKITTEIEIEIAS